jgi:di/tricarboxylate transporter
MTLSMAFLFGLLAVMVVLFLTERLPIDLTAFLGLVVLVFAGYVTPAEAFAGFSSSAVITMLSIFIVSAALLQTGLADAMGSTIHRLVGSREVPLMITVMLSAGVLSAFMNNIAATAVLMPAVATLGRSAGLSPARLFMPLSFGAILGGTTTLVGTPPNILAGAMLEDRGLDSFKLFDFAPYGLALLGVGVLFMITFGRRLLPDAGGAGGAERAPNLADIYRLHENTFALRVPKGSALDGVKLGDTRLSTAVGGQIVSIVRAGERDLTPSADTELRADDELIVQGRLEDLRELSRVKGLDVEEARDEVLTPQEGFSGLRARLTAQSELAGQTLRELRFRERHGLIVIALERGGRVFREELGDAALATGDVLFAIGSPAQVEDAARLPHLEVLEIGVEALRRLQEHPLFALVVPTGSPLAGTSVMHSRMGQLIGLTIVAIAREGSDPIPVTPDEVFAVGDRLLISGERARVIGLLAMGDLLMESESIRPELESDEVGLIEAAISPRSQLGGHTLADLKFRERYGVQVLGIWRQAEPIREGLTELALRIGDGLLLRGERAKLRLIAADPDFVTLTAEPPERRTRKAPYALGGLALMIVLVVSGLQPIQVAAFTAATLVILSGALKMEEAYRAIEWRAIFLVAAVLPVGSAMESSGAAGFLAGGVSEVAGPLGPYAVLAALVVLSSALSQGLDGAPAVVLLTPVVLESAQSLAISPYPLMMGVSLAASAAFMTPFSHKANLLVMGLGGYRSVDYLRVGTPLTIVLLALIVLLVPLGFPF